MRQFYRMHFYSSQLLKLGGRILNILSPRSEKTYVLCPYMFCTWSTNEVFFYFYRASMLGLMAPEGFRSMNQTSTWPSQTYKVFNIGASASGMQSPPSDQTLRFSKDYDFFMRKLSINDWHTTYESLTPLKINFVCAFHDSLCTRSGWRICWTELSMHQTL